METAEGPLMKSRGISEKEAYQALPTFAMQKRKPAQEIRDIVIYMADVLPKQ